MYENVKYLGMTLKEWRDKVFHGAYSLGELYRMVKEVKDLKKLTNAKV